jgi:hypothetical protein
MCSSSPRPYRYANVTAQGDQMPRGFVYRTYVADDGSHFETRVDADQAADTTRGWADVEPGAPLIPRGLKERKMIGISPSTGRTGRIRVGDTVCDLWSGVATTFTVEANDGTIDTMVVTERRQERRQVSH